MTSAVTNILNAIETRVQALLPSYSRLKYSYDLEKNDKRKSSNAYGIGAGAADEVTGTNRTVTFDQEFFVVLSNDFGGRSDDTAERTALKGLYDDLETLYVDFAESKLGIPSQVYVVNSVSIDEPEKIGQNVISIRMNFTVKHRKAT